MLPDIEVHAGEALDAAYHHALDGLLQKATDIRLRSRLQWARVEFEANQHPIELTTDQLADYSGTYGNRVFTADRKGSLSYVPEPGSAYMLVPLAEDLFGVEGFEDRRFMFERDLAGRVVRVLSPGVDGSRVARSRTGPPQ